MISTQQVHIEQTALEAEITVSPSSQDNNQQVFNPQILLDAFQESITQSAMQDKPPVDDIRLKDYLRAYEEIVKFLEHLGAVFYFVIVDIKEKIGILRNLNETNPKDYETILKTVHYEKHVINAFAASSPIAATNGSRTILRLHRALIFIYKFLDKLFTADTKAKSSQLCTEVYENTLAKHHGWLIRKAATFGMRALPKRESLVAFMCRSPEDHTKFPVFVKCVERVYDITEGIYEEHDVLNLP